ncbi:MAG: sigma-70 family RNA polymerase sigma factor [Verrucomicrobia bacterium]|nr:sigma-70 family RNA polymerase sigma factor [Verrucomicrobiota bacterium]
MPSFPDPAVPTRHSLLSRLRHWDESESWQTFFDTYWRLIYSTARKAGLGDADAQDVVQETILAVAKTMPGFKYDPKVCSFKGWLLLLTRRRISDHLRQRQRRLGGGQFQERVGTSVLEDLPDAGAVSLDEVWEQAWQKNLMEAAVARVKGRVRARQYQIFDLYVIKQWRAAEVARVLHVNVAQVYLAAHRVGRMIKAEVKKLETRKV